ncbi:MAG TPA: hypothetical protein PK078_00415 [Anaerolineales bacterium]|nr:hypothetical protein [Anaerolineales bacterium]HNB35278.1 hypothetical protein [Anaerolineales bacterium]
MTNICILGNSHVGSLKRGWDAIYNDYQQIRITFFAQRSDGIEGLIVHDGKLIPNNEDLMNALAFTSGGKTDILPDDYDVFIIYGVGAHVNFDIHSQFYSRTVIESTIKDLVVDTLSFKLLQRLRKITSKPIYIGHMPLLAATQVQLEASPNDYLARVELINEIIYRPFHAEMVKQPVFTIVNGNNTHPKFSKDSKRLAIGDQYDDQHHPDEDIDHMNDQFGEIWLKEYFENYLRI